MQPAVTPLVSVSMITYQHARYIRQALDSALMQQVDFPIEICIGEDGSTDGTREICQEYAAKHPDVIRLFLRDRANPARQQYRAPFMHNFIETLKACRGKYIALLEGDDYWTDAAKLQKQHDFLEAHGDGILCSTNFRIVSEDGTVKRESEGILSAGQYVEIPLGSLLSANCVATCTCMVRRKAVTLLTPQFLQLAMGDWPLWILSAGHGRLYRLCDTCACYRIHSGGAWSQKDPIVWLQQEIKVLRAVYESVGKDHRQYVRQGIASRRAKLAVRVQDRTKRDILLLESGLRSLAFPKIGKAAMLLMNSLRLSGAGVWAYCQNRMRAALRRIASR